MSTQSCVRRHGYSAVVTLTLRFDSVELALSHLGPSSFIVRHDCQPIPSGDAKLIVKIDDHVEEHKVFLPHGIERPGVRVAYL